MWSVHEQLDLVADLEPGSALGQELSEISEKGSREFRLPQLVDLVEAQAVERVAESAVEPVVGLAVIPVPGMLVVPVQVIRVWYHQ